MVYLGNTPLSDKGSRRIEYCKNCLMPNSRPRIVFDEDGICNACHHAENKFEGIDWEARREEFLQILDSHRSKDGWWDCIVPWSGGKDSSSIAYKLKYEYDMNPLLVTFSPMLPTNVGNHNREALLRAGFDNVFFRPDQRVHRYLAKRFFIERGNHKVAWDAGINVLPVMSALKYDIKLIFYAEHGESEYGGKLIHKDSNKIRDYSEVLEHQIGDDPRNWADDKVTIKELQPYIYPDLVDIERVGVRAYYFSWFHKWSMFENYNYIKERIDFQTHPEGRTPGTFTDFDSLDDKVDPLYYFMQFVKFGFGRCVRDTSRFIQNKDMERSEALELCKKFDHEFPSEYFSEVLEYLDMTEDEFHAVVDNHRNIEIWNNNDGVWALRYPLPETA